MVMICFNTIFRLDNELIEKHVDIISNELYLNREPAAYILPEYRANFIFKIAPHLYNNKFHILKERIGRSVNNLDYKISYLFVVILLIEIRVANICKFLFLFKLF